MTTPDIKIFDSALGYFSSDKISYHRDERDYLVFPMRTKDIWYEYIPIGGDIELDRYGLLEHYLYCTVHMRNVKSVDEKFLVTMLAHIRKFIVDKTASAEYSKPYTQVIEEDIPDTFTLRIGSVLLDPGFTGHVRKQPKDNGVTISTLNVYYPDEMTSEIKDSLDKISLKQLLLDPHSVYSSFVLPKVDQINKALEPLQHQLHEKKKLNAYQNALLSKKRKLGSVIRYDMGDLRAPLNTTEFLEAGDPKPVEVYYEWYGPKPSISLNVDMFSSRVSGDWNFDRGLLNSEYGFKIWLDTIPEIRQHILSSESNTHDFIEAIKTQMRLDFRKYNINTIFISNVNFLIQD